MGRGAESGGSRGRKTLIRQEVPSSASRRFLLGQLDRAVVRSQDPALTALADEIATWPAIPGRQHWSHLPADDADNPVLSWRVEIDGTELSMFTMMSTFGTPIDVTLSDLSVELFFPADEATEAILRRHAQPSGK